MRKELHSRQVFDIGTTKKKNTQALKEGVQRVPSLLLNNPTQTSILRTISGDGLWHDLKGNLFDELPLILEQPLSAELSLTPT